ncbi:hypothetical protein GOP47_0008830 [Adiantum capillus-veneris]|uniref:Uncharacterized protein n=1 Tax=Adiantum capillus-veneris TaxID=13818 RepID=A0A9D4ZL34_ADICA|nr:hypothetical protein GOP47_0008830 [Adiantum capillus-veneris]
MVLSSLGRDGWSGAEKADHAGEKHVWSRIVVVAVANDVRGETFDGPGLPLTVAWPGYAITAYCSP